MAKKEKIPKRPRIMTCERTGRDFEYRGVGRPPKYHPDIVETVRAEQRKAVQKKLRGEKKAARGKDLADVLAA